jgi:hypothetical protein
LPLPFLLKFQKDLEKASDTIEEMDELEDGALSNG